MDSDVIIKTLLELGRSIMLTKRQAELLAIMRDDDKYLIIAGDEVWVGLQRTSVAMAYLMLRYMWIKEQSTEATDENYMMYEITERGLAALKRYEEGS